MNQEKLQTELYVTRDFGRKLSDTIEFIRSNWRLLLRYETYLLLPISVILAFFTNNLVSDYSGMLTGMMGVTMYGSGLYRNYDNILEWFINLFGTFVCYGAAFIALSAVVYAVIYFVFFTDKKMTEVSFEELNPRLWYYAKRSLVLSLVTLVLCIVASIALVVVLVGLTFLFSSMRFAILPIYLFIILAVVAVTIPLLLVTPIYMLEPECSVVNAFMKAFRLGFATWAGVFAVSFVIGLVSTIFEMVTTMPWYVMIITKHIFTLAHDGDAGMTGSFLFSFTQYLFCILQCFGMMVASTLSIVGITIQYGHAADKIDGRGVAQHIDHFDQFDNV
ncbi:hypothetical protein [Xylanibacter brevis]|uniref:hypothetical protein n=1 Tax=Xylanibacter brevis TaxID=83231 RepID=UPI000482B0B7|nr:hypothetical protein [Xylanibacter brevis]